MVNELATYGELDGEALRERLGVAERDNAALAAENAALAADAGELARRLAEAQAALEESRAAVAESQAAVAESQAAAAESQAELAEARRSRDDALAEVGELRASVSRLVERCMALKAAFLSPRSERSRSLAEALTEGCQTVLPGLALKDAKADPEPGPEQDPEPDPEPEQDPEPEAEPAGGAGGKGKGKGRRKGGGKGTGGRARALELLDDLEVTRVVDHTLDDPTCPACGGELTEMGYEERKVVELVPAHLEVTMHRYHKYVCKGCSRENQRTGGEVGATIERAPREGLVLPGTIASPSLIAFAAGQKYEWSSSLNREWRKLAEMGAPFSRQTLTRWVIAAWEERLSGLEAQIWDRARGAPVLQVDETTVQVLKEPGRRARTKSYMWVAVTGELCEGPAAAHFEYRPTRAHAAAAELVEGLSCVVVSDAYGAYDHLGEGVGNSRCLAHVRRKFADIVKGLGAEAARGTVAAEALGRIGEIYAAERGLRGLGADERAERRGAEVRPLLEGLRGWCAERRAEAVPGGRLDKALAYAVGNLALMGPYLEDGLVPIDNNHAERTVRPFACGRHSWLFADTVAGARASAGIYSIVRTAAMNGLSGTRYLEWALTELTARTPDEGDVEGWDRLMPWSDEARAACAAGRPDAAGVGDEADEDEAA